MFFNSLEFLVLLAVTVVLYYMPLGGPWRRVWQVGLLLASSAVFYAWENPKLLILLTLSCVMNAVAVERILFYRGRNSGNAARRWLVLTVVANLGLLTFFKYAGFLASLLPEALAMDVMKHWISSIPLPVGISFYTFQGISLVVDTWRRDISPQSIEMLARRGRERLASIRDLSFYISFFPQLVAGPIVTARDFMDQIGAKLLREVDWVTVRRGLVCGYFLKMFVADNIAEQTAALTLGAGKVAGMSTVNSLSLLYAYSLQIFADFAGYSLIAVGLGALFGYKLPPNFNFPYLSTSITEFWRRWHLSLSSWLRDYLYIPLGGNRKGSGRTYFNLFLVMFLGGLWHGAAWKFALWGSLHGIFLAAERLIGRRAKSGKLETCKSGSENVESSRFNHHAPSSKMLPAGDRQAAGDGEGGERTLFGILHSAFIIGKWIVTFHLITFLWLTFMMPDMASITGFFESLGRAKLSFSGPPVFTLMFYGSAVVAYHLWGWIGEHRHHWALKLARSPLEPLLHGIMVFLVIVNSGAPRGFIYFQF